jgi:hypothetical protein
LLKVKLYNNLDIRISLQRLAELQPLNQLWGHLMFLKKNVGRHLQVMEHVKIEPVNKM